MAREPGAGVGEALTKGEWPILTLAAYRRRGCCSETVAVTDPPHAAKNGSLQLFSMSRVLTIGEYPVLLMDLIATQLHEKASGLLACDVNGSDRMDVGAALRRLNFSVRAAMARTLGERTLGTLAYLWAMDSGVAAWLDRDPQLTPHERIERACNNLIFLRWWHAWLEAEGKARSEAFISMETFRAFVLLDEAMILLVLVWAKRHPDKPFAYAADAPAPTPPSRTPHPTRRGHGQPSAAPQ